MVARRKSYNTTKDLEDTDRPLRSLCAVLHIYVQ